MGANSIDISQYRSRIGTFAGNKSTCRTSKASMNTLKTNTILESFVILSYLLILSNVTQNLLIISGLELNPGPYTLGKNYFMAQYSFEMIRVQLIYSFNFLSNSIKYLQINLHR